MNDFDPIPVIPTLAYANPQGAQPLGGRLEVVYDRDGVTVTDPRSADTSPVLIKWVGVVLFVVGVAMTIVGVGLMIKYRTLFENRILACTSAAIASTACGVACYLLSSKQKQDPRVVRIKHNRVHTEGCPGHTWISNWLNAKKFIISGGSTDLATMRRLYSIKVRYPLWRSYLLIPALSKDEAVWAVELMNKALHDESTVKRQT